MNTQYLSRRYNEECINLNLSRTIKRKMDKMFLKILKKISVLGDDIGADVSVDSFPSIEVSLSFDNVRICITSLYEKHLFFYRFSNDLRILVCRDDEILNSVETDCEDIINIDRFITWLRRFKKGEER